jgi:hypothetical protein
MRALGNVPGAGASRSGFVTGGRRTLTTWLGTVRPVTGGLGRVLHKTSPTWQSRCARSRSLLRETARTAGSRLTTSGADSTYDSPDDFVAGVPPSEIAKIKGVMIGYTDGDPVVTVQILRSPLPGRYSPFIRASGKERAAVEAVARLVTNLFSGRRFVRQDLRRPGQVPLFERIRARLGWLGVIVLTAAITAAVTIGVTNLLSSDTNTPAPTTTSTTTAS